MNQTLRCHTPWWSLTQFLKHSNISENTETEFENMLVLFITVTNGFKSWKKEMSKILLHTHTQNAQENTRTILFSMQRRNEVLKDMALGWDEICFVVCK